ncbi:MAG: Protein-arginine kinase activator protein [Phycisphaerae bacterium]|nr:Protein-arginine kinase activator protein [Phycisphaerae bacterium]
MKCQSPKCNNPATVHLTEIIGGEKREKHLCEECAAGEGITTGKTPVSLNEWLQNFVMQQSGAAAAKTGEMVCGSCGMTFAEFRQRGLLGCPACYKAFEQVLMPLISRAHGNATHHVGKVPSTMDKTQRRQYELVDLRRRLRDAVATEQYEQAAQLRDRISELEN